MEVTRMDSEVPVMNHSFNSKESSLLRASRVTLVLGGLGRIFASSEGSAETYVLSEPVTRMDTFLSHNWSTNRFAKFAILAMHYNFIPAVIATSLAMSAIFSLTALGFLPLWEKKPVPEAPVGRTGICATILGPWIFLLVLFTWHEVAGRVGLMKGKLFLDKTCIHQVDPEKKQRGILNLAAFLERTDSMLVVYTSTYLTRLWTVFELASLLILYPEKELRVMPTYFSRPVVLGSLSWYVGTIIFNFTEFNYGIVGHVGPLPITLNLLRALFGGAFINITAHLYVSEKHTIWSAAQSFRLSNAACAVESDRELVTRSVEKFLKERRLVPESTPRNKALQSFDRMVHRDVPAKLLESHGSIGIPYKYIVVVFAPIWFRSVDWLSAMVHEHAELEEVLFHIGLQLSTAVMFLPLQSALAAVLADLIPPQKRWQGAVLRVGSLLTTCSMAVVNHLGITILSGKFKNDRVIAVSLLAVYVAFPAFLQRCLQNLVRKAYRNHLQLEAKDELQPLTSN